MNKDFEENSLYDLDENSPIHGSFVKEILQADHEPSTFNSLNGSEIPQDKVKSFHIFHQKIKKNNKKTTKINRII